MSVTRLVALPLIVLLVSCSSGGGGGGGQADTAVGQDVVAQADTATAWQIPEPFSPPAKNALVGQVMAPGGVPVAGATVSAGALAATTDYQGFYFLEGVPLGETVLVTFRAPGYSPVVKKGLVSDGSNATLNALLLPHVQSRVLDATTGGDATFESGAVALEPGAVVDTDGNAVTGELRVRMSAIDIRSNQILAAPGDFSAKNAAGKEVQLETFGLADISLEQDGQPLKLKDGQTAEVELLLPEGSTAKVGDEIPLWSFDEATAKWIEEGKATVQDSARFPGRKSAVGAVAHFSWWNCDQEMETTCISGTVKTCDGKPAPGAFVQGVGVSYDGTSDAGADANGKFCVPAKKGSKVRITATSGWGVNALARVVEVDTQDVVAQCGSASCMPLDITLPCTPADNDVDCSDTYFVPCRGCISGRVVDRDGAPVAGAEVTVKSGNTTYKQYTDSDGAYCSQAGLTGSTTLAAMGPGGNSKPLAVTVTTEGTCPDCQQVADLVLEDSGGGQEEEFVDLCTCAGINGSVVVQQVDLDNVDPVFASITRGHGVVYVPDPASGDTQKTSSIELMFYPDCESSKNDLPVATVDLSVSEGSFPIGVPMPEQAPTEGSLAMNGVASSRPKLTVLMGNQTLDLVTQQWDVTPQSSFTIESGDLTPGSTVKGGFVLFYRAQCAPAGGAIRIVGTFELPVRSYGEVWTAMDVESETFRAWLCEMMGTLVELEQGFLSSWSAGFTQLFVDGVEIPQDENTTVAAQYLTSQNQMSLSFYSEVANFTLYGANPVSGETPATSGSLYVALEPNCYYELQSGSTFTIDGTPGSPDTPILQGSFDASFKKSEWTEETCKPHTATGSFVAATCYSTF